jgi:signal transduction histidine kinase/ligand-binding sensor domain-containing protein
MRLVLAVPHHFLVIAFFCFAGIIPSQAQQQYSRFGHLTVDDGLSSNRIRCLYRDSKDYLWMGTDVGLDKYDSYQIKKYRYGEKQPGTISSDKINCIYEDRGRNLWFGTLDGLNLYDPAKDNFTVFKNNPADNNSLNSNCINSIIEDKDGIIWVVTDRNCLNKWIPETQEFIRYQFDIEKSDINPRPSRMIATDSKGNLWIVSLSRGIQSFDPQSGKFTKYDDAFLDLGYNCYKSMYIDNQDKMWIATDGYGFFSFDPVTSKFEQFGSKGDGKGTNQNIVLDILPEDDRYLLLAVDQGGINRFDKVSETFEYILYDQTNDEGLNNNGIWCLHRDREGILWIGTSGGGINYYNSKEDRFKLFTNTGNGPRSLSYNFTGCFFEDHLGLIWIGTDGGGVNVYDPETGNFKKYKHEPSDPYSISGNVIRGIAEDKDHDIWIGTWGAGLNRYDRKTGRFFRYMTDNNDPSSISNNTVWNLIIDHNNTLWLSLYDVGIDLFEIGKGVTSRFRPDPDNPGSLSGNNSWFFFEDLNKKMWICTQNGLDLFDSTTNSFKVYHFPDNDIGAVYIDNGGYLWVGSNTKGLFMCHQNGTILKTYDITNILPNNRIHAITQDSKGGIWISSNYGLSRLNTEIQHIRNYSKADGLQDDQFYQQSFLKTRKGEMYFGGYNGFNSFYPDSLKDNDFIPPVYITDFQIFNKPVIYGSQEGQFPIHVSEAKEITLTWRQSVFSFSFNAINYTHPKKNQYAYIMGGFEKEWNYTDASRRYVTYTNLDPGEYTFRVKATNNDGIWNEKGVSLRIIILPPWWSTWWFRLVVISLIIFILASLFLSRVRQLNNQKIMLEKLVATKTAELYELNASKDKFFSIIAHDLKNPFNAIIGFSEMQKEEIRSGNPERIEEYAGIINDSAIQTLRLLENLLEWANSQTGKILFNPISIKLCELFDEDISILNDMATGKNIEIKSSIPDNLTIIADKNMIKTILRNLISNAIKFTHKNGKVEVKALIDKKQVEISVSDSGIGMTKETMAKLFRIDANLSTRGTENERGTGLGLFLCKEFVEKHGGKIWVESESGKGSTFKFILPLSIDHSV